VTLLDGGGAEAIQLNGGRAEINFADSIPGSINQPVPPCYPS